MNTLISFDGPKGVGKTTLIRLVHQRLSASSHPVVALVEKDLIPAPQAALLRSLYAAMKLYPTLETDKAIADALKSARLKLTREVLPTFDGAVILLDRWYPSDAVFRRFLSSDETVAANIAEGVRVPDLTFAVQCDPGISWQRATARERNLDSKVIRTYDDHYQATLSFERAAQQFGWRIVRSDSRTPEMLAEEVCSEIAGVMGRANLR